MISSIETAYTVAIAMKTYRKPDAYKVEHESLLEFGYADDCLFITSSDDDAEIIEELGYSSLDVYNKLKAHCRSVYLCGDRLGIAGNSNRIIWYFLNKCKAPYLLLLDDDLRFIAPGLIKELIEILKSNKLQHVTGRWEDPPGRDPIPGATGNLWFQDFPVIAQGDRITWHNMGSHGNASFYSREIIEKIGYFDIFKGSFYGLEHASHTCRAMRASGRTPLLHPQHERAWKYYHGQAIPNRYGGTKEDIAAAEKAFWPLFQKTYDGIHINVKDPGFDPKKLRICE